jgi:hypothetical protein
LGRKICSRDLPLDIVQKSWTLSEIPGLCPLGSFSSMFVHCFGHILLTGVQLIAFFFRFFRNFKRTTSMLLVGVCSSFLVWFWLWGLNLGHRLFLVKEFDSVTVHPSPLQPPPSVPQPLHLPRHRAPIPSLLTVGYPPFHPAIF